tara:strand:- start:6177 stop:7493 length:1317 start_codon:yes stop_codon:yes gene_type:complete
MKKVNSGYKLWKKSIKVIPGGTGLLSKRPDRYASYKWPTYFGSAKGIKIIDLDGNIWRDFAQMGLGCAILGYNNPQLNKHVNKFINKGINTTLNCPEEFFLAKKLLSLNKFAKGVRFCRSGGEAMSIAVRIARAKTKSTKVAFSGYHGWHDWYLSTNLQNKDNLNKHLISNLSTLGVPKELKNSIFPFKFNSVEELKKILLKSKSTKIIIIEGARKDTINLEMVKYLNKLQKIDKYVIILDEITSGFRTSASGVYKKIGLIPNIVVYGKALGNGFAINAIVGDECMDYAEESFISSSFHTERVGFVAALKTIEIIEKEKLWFHLNRMGKKIISSWIQIANKNNINITTNSFYPLPSFAFNYNESLNFNTYFIQELTKYNILGANSIYLSKCHTNVEIEKYLNKVEIIFKKLSKIINSKTNKNNYLEIPQIQTGFGRLT